MLYDNSNTFADEGYLKVKYLVNAGNLKCILKRHPLINLKKNLIAVQSCKQGLSIDV